MKHPIILPKLHHVMKLIVMDYHVRKGYSGPAHTLSALREKFWVLKGMSTVKGVLLKSFKCRFRRAVVGKQIMAPLPQFQVNPGGFAFSCSRVDFMGPLTVKSGRNELKQYVCVFPSMASRAVHLELTFSLNTSSFLLALQPFMN